MKNSKTCAWCHKPTDMVKIFAADTPILEWMEEKITNYCEKHNIEREKLWGYDSNWDDLHLPAVLEAELAVYDELIETGKGNSKKKSEQDASKNALVKFHVLSE